MAAFFQSKVTVIDQKISAQEDKLIKQDAKIKTLDSFVQGEVAKLKKQVTDLGQGKVTSEEELNAYGDQQALVDQQQDEMIQGIRADMEEKFAAL